MPDADLILTSGPLELRAMDDGRGGYPAMRWYEGLEPRLKARVMARLDNISNSLQSGRPDQALAVLRGSRVGLLEMRGDAGRWPAASPEAVRPAPGQ